MSGKGLLFVAKASHPYGEAYKVYSKIVSRESLKYYQMGFHYIRGMAEVEFLLLKSCSGLDDAMFRRNWVWVCKIVKDGHHLFRGKRG